MLVELRLLKRQDLVGVISNLMKPAHDQIHVRVDMSPEDMDSFIFCIASKKSSLRFVLSVHETRGTLPGAPPFYSVSHTYGQLNMSHMSLMVFVFSFDVNLYFNLGVVTLHITDGHPKLLE